MSDPEAGDPKAKKYVDLLGVSKEYPNISEYCHILIADIPLAEPDETYLSKFIEIVGDQKWKDISAMPRKTMKGKREVFVAVLQALRTKLIHRSEGQTEGQRLEGGVYASNCTYTSQLAVNTLLGLGIHAEVHSTSRFKDIFEDYRPNFGLSGHDLPWVPEICAGLADGDGLYSKKKHFAGKDAADLLENWKEIKQYWGASLKAAEQIAERLDGEFRKEGTSHEQQLAQEFRNTFRDQAVSIRCYIPSSSKCTIEISLIQIIDAMPAPLILSFRPKGAWWYQPLENMFTAAPFDKEAGQYGSVRNRGANPFIIYKLLDLQQYFSKTKSVPEVFLRIYLPQELQTPVYRLPKTEAEAISLAVHLVHRNAVEERATNEAAEVI